MENQNNEIVKLDMAQYGLEENKATQIKNLYLPMIKLLEEIEGEFNDIVGQEITPEISMRARTLRLKIVPYRTDADKARISAKEESLRIGKAIQGAYNTFEWATKSKEEKLLGIEKHLEKIEIERKGKLKEEREKALAKYEVETEHIQLSEMSDEVWNNYFSGVKLQYDNKIAAEKQAEADRITKEKAEKEEKERIRKENERLQKEADEREKAMKKERAEAEAKQKAIEEQARKEREAAEVKAQKEADEKAKLEKELQARKDAEIQAEKVKQAIIENELSKGDKDKFQSQDDLRFHQSNFAEIYGCSGGPRESGVGVGALARGAERAEDRASAPRND